MLAIDDARPSRTRSPLRVWLTVAALAVGCASETAVAGVEEGPCYPNETCNEGLRCVESVCVAQGGDTTGPSPANSGHPSGDTSGDSCGADLLRCRGALFECGEAFLACRGLDGAARCDAVAEVCELLEEPASHCEQDWSHCVGTSDAADGETDSTVTEGGDDLGDADTGSDDPGAGTDDGGGASAECAAWASAYCGCLGRFASDNCIEEARSNCGVFEDVCPNWVTCATSSFCTNGSTGLDGVVVTEQCGVCEER